MKQTKKKKDRDKANVRDLGWNVMVSGGEEEEEEEVKTLDTLYTYCDDLGEE